MSVQEKLPPILADHPVRHILQEIHARYRDDRTGNLASYIPELMRADPDDFGLAAAITDGFVYEVGETRKPFTIQSISKPVLYALALQDHGREAVLERVGVEPSGDPFNSITFDQRYNRPFNPMVNSGAIAVTALVGGQGLEQRQARILDLFAALVGHPVTIDDAVYRSESATGHRNRAIAYLELNAGMIEPPVDEHLDLYFRQCAILVTARDLAVMAATLANDGTNPITGRTALTPALARDVLSVMTTCGMYDYAGGWQFDVGLPAKSGVSGGILAVLPEQLGLGLYSPRLDEIGNSHRGIRACKDLSSELKLHMLDFRGTQPSVLRRQYRGSEVRSKRRRRPNDTAVLDRDGHRIAVYEVQGSLSFASAERLSRRLLGEAESFDHAVLDLQRVVSMDRVAQDVLARLSDVLASHGRRPVMVVPPPTPGFAEPPAGYRAAESIDAALEICEDLVLRAAGMDQTTEEVGSLRDVQMLAELDDREISRLRAYLDEEHFAAGDALAHEGEKADRLFFSLSGRCDVLVDVEGADRRYRLGSIEAGNLFGETALFEGGHRTAAIVAVTDVTCLVMTHERFEALQREEPTLYGRLLLQVGRNLADRLRRANAEVSVLAR